MSIRTSDDFQVGQRVACTDPENFIAQTARKLTNREGIVVGVTPAVPKKGYCGHVNKVFVEWQKRSARGAIERMMMSPRDIHPIEEKA